MSQFPTEAAVKGLQWPTLLFDQEHFAHQNQGEINDLIYYYTTFLDQAVEQFKVM